MSLKNYSFPKSINELISPYILTDKADGFYNEQKNSLDVVFVGSNNVHCDITPNIIWNEFGITSYNFSSDSQDLGTSYYYLKQVFETQTPKVVMIDILNNGSEESITALEAHFSFDFMKNDLYKIQAIFNRTKEDRLEILFPLITYHSRRKELNKDDFLYRHNRHNILKGSFIYMGEQFSAEPFEIPENDPNYE